MRPSGRAIDIMRPIEVEVGFTKHAEGSCLIKCGDTHVLCTASVEDRTPPWLRNTGMGWSQQSMECYLDLLAQEIVEKLLLENNLAEHKKYKDLLEDHFVLGLIA